MGLLFGKRGGPNSELLVVNQNIGVPIPGEVLRYDGIDGSFLDALVSTADPDAPFAPRGLVLGKHQTLFVADLGQPGDPTLPGRLTTFDVRTGEFLGDLDTTGFDGLFRPRGVVFGPDGSLYVSVTNLPDQLGGHILRFDPDTGEFLDVVVDGDTCDCDLHRPEGLVFGPDGRLYVASFRADACDTDKILIFELVDGVGVLDEQIELFDCEPDPAGGCACEPRAFAQDLLFGPGGALYVPISGGSVENTGSVRRYDVDTGNFDVIVEPSSEGGPLGAPFYLTFRGTDPATLAYEGPKNPKCLSQ
ncbi:Vgb family protein [Nannocystis punicea]|uniref:SMP-30/Gluconolactonase/LRE-like region domain-containing protein n=1 Tax=Nannocystis punicea TaxID=2995304 RepID=A0ABY7HIR6_9BACT|nr:hypothetical protein [Nannocystis poenicansa]WAS99225.1 hypothetical protein O0S08_24110 [Nannocystis poenicansa]